MRLIPKESKIKTTFYKGVTLVDAILGIACLGLDEIEFWEWPDDMGYVVEDALWRIDDFGEPLYVYEAKRFSYRGEMFQVLGDADFGALFA